MSSGWRIESVTSQANFGFRGATTRQPLHQAGFGLVTTRILDGIVTLATLAVFRGRQALRSMRR